MKRSIVLGLAAILATTFALCGEGRAGLVSCPTSFFDNPTARVESLSGSTAVSGCQYDAALDNSRAAKIPTINGLGFFGFSDWEGNGQTQLQGEGLAGQSGWWSIADPQFADYDYLIVFKSGRGTGLTGFLFNEQYWFGLWTTPFTASLLSSSDDISLLGDDEGKKKDVSHYTIVRREKASPPDPVPEPASLGLLGAALLGLAVLRRRRSV